MLLEAKVNEVLVVVQPSGFCNVEALASFLVSMARWNHSDPSRTQV